LVVVFDPDPGAGASAAAAGMLCPVSEAHYGEQRLLELNLASARRWPSFAAELEAASDIDVGYRRDGTLAVAFDDDDLRVLDELLSFQQSLGLDSARLRSRECRALEPRLSPRVRGGIFVDGDHQVDNRSVVAALLRAAERAGVRIVREAVASPAEVDADIVVVAAGCWSASLCPDVSVRPVKGQILRLRFDPDDPVLTRNVRGLVAGRSVYLVPRSSGELVVGATVEEQGYDTTVTAGAVDDLLRAAIDLVPGVSELELVETRAGLRPGTPDNAPIIGWSRSDPRVIHATGHYRHGILLTPITADVVASLVAGESVPPIVEPLGANRWARCT
jgi:glycine oxidase